MSRTVRLPVRPPRRMIVAAAILIGVLTASGCAAGQVAQTAQEVAAIDGANAHVGDIGIRNALFARPSGPNYPAGSDVPLTFWLTNDGLNADTLSQLSSPVAASVEISGGKATVPGGTSAQFSTETPVKVTLKGITNPLVYGKSVPVTFAFDNAGQVTTNITLEVPVERSGDRPTIDIQPAEPIPLWLTGEAGHGEG